MMQDDQWVCLKIGETEVYNLNPILDRSSLFPHSNRHPGGNMFGL